MVNVNSNVIGHCFAVVSIVDGGVVVFAREDKINLYDCNINRVPFMLSEGVYIAYDTFKLYDNMCEALSLILNREGLFVECHIAVVNINEVVFISNLQLCAYSKGVKVSPVVIEWIDV